MLPYAAFLSEVLPELPGTCSRSPNHHHGSGQTIRWLHEDYLKRSQCITLHSNLGLETWRWNTVETFQTYCIGLPLKHDRPPSILWHRGIMFFECIHGELTAQPRPLSILSLSKITTPEPGVAVVWSIAIQLLVNAVATLMRRFSSPL